ncbi:MAG: dTDP-4-dehydrorhamnose reductase [Sutterellaceae bacterium]|nr:dTDP-4-dehydrorhamnose reductase [Sutterellaceae bacterium]MDD7441801.1 dTDP-4-dehydrorhamnose reductase [Sutterellaceae bacterium]MDY2868526.1 dTDP-4-dehydrorhamnose reductase [Mesosutterella sp.]
MLLFGRTGQVGSALIQELKTIPGLDLLAPGRSDGADFTNPLDPAKFVRSFRPDLVLNAAAFTAVDEAEKDEQAARLVNAEAPVEIARAVAETGALLVHFGTDYVFDGSGDAPWSEDDTPSPLNAYGRTKLEGEEGIRSTGANALILRTSWVTGPGKPGFLSAILRSGVEGREIRVVRNEAGTPAAPGFLARTALLASRRYIDGRMAGATVLNAVPDSFTTRVEFAQWILGRAAELGARVKTSPEDVIPVDSLVPPRPARRPANSRLDNSRLKAFLGVGSLGRWDEWLEPVLEAWVARAKENR